MALRFRSRSKRKNTIALIAALLAAAVLSGLFALDYKLNTSKHDHHDFVMGTVVSLKLTGQGGPATAEKIVKQMRNLEYKQLSWRVADTYIAKANAKAGLASFEPDEETLRYLEDSLKICRASKGALDISIGKITALWDFDSDEKVLPDKGEIEALLPFVDYKNIDLSDGQIFVGQNQALDMGAVGKGIACDEARAPLRVSSVKSAIVSVGGSVLLYNTEARVGIRNPDGGPNDYLGILKLKNCNISTSGNYEKAFEFEGEKYHHILDPKTGYPVDNDLAGVTVICKDGLTADALSTACFVLGYKDSLPLLEEYEARAVFVFKDKSVRTSGLLEKDFSLTDSAYQLV